MKIMLASVEITAIKMLFSALFLIFVYHLSTIDSDMLSSILTEVELASLLI
jgi:hypothetical protein